MKKTFALRLMLVLTLIAILVAAVDSLSLMFEAGRNQKSILLLVLFTGWVLSPFVVLFIGNLISTRWQAITRVRLCLISVLILLGSLAGYHRAFSQPDTKGAFMFLVVPFLSWVLIAIVILLARYQKKYEL